MLDKEQIENWGDRLPLTDIFKKKSDGGPSAYYDLPKNCVTLNDLLEWKGDSQWRGDSFHLSNIIKAAWRWGIKQGTSESYDARKFIYSGARLLMKHSSKTELRAYLLQLLEDPQFKVEEENE